MESMQGPSSLLEEFPKDSKKGGIAKEGDRSGLSPLTVVFGWSAALSAVGFVSSQIVNRLGVEIFKANSLHTAVYNGELLPCALLSQALWMTLDQSLDIEKKCKTFLHHRKWSAQTIEMVSKVIRIAFIATSTLLMASTFSSLMGMPISFVKIVGIHAIGLAAIFGGFGLYLLAKPLLENPFHSNFRSSFTFVSFGLLGAQAAGIAALAHSAGFAALAVNPLHAFVFTAGNMSLGWVNHLLCNKYKEATQSKFQVQRQSNGKMVVYEALSTLALSVFAIPTMAPRLALPFFQGIKITVLAAASFGGIMSIGYLGLKNLISNESRSGPYHNPFLQ